MKHKAPIPEQIEPKSLADYLEIMTRAVFQAGVSWALVDSKWDAFRRSFNNFEPEKISRFSDKDLELLLQDKGILHSRKKIAATIHNASVLLELDKQFHGFKNYLRSFSDYASLSSDMKKRFRYIGELSVYYFLFRIREPVPPFVDWVQTIEGDHPRMAEMIEQASRATAKW